MLPTLAPFSHRVRSKRIILSNSRTNTWEQSSFPTTWGDESHAVYRRRNVGEQFQKQHFDARLGWHETTVPRETVRNELIAQLTRSPSTSAEQSGEGAASEPDTFIVEPVRELRSP